jgi:hypothetical protein
MAMWCLPSCSALLIGVGFGWLVERDWLVGMCGLRFCGRALSSLVGGGFSASCTLGRCGLAAELSVSHSPAALLLMGYVSYTVCIVLCGWIEGAAFPVYQQCWAV